jgi:hypothetical protein
MDNSFLKKKIDYFWEYDYSFGAVFLKSLFGDRYKRKYSQDGAGIFNLIYGDDGNIYELKLTQATKLIAADTLPSRNKYQCEIADLVAQSLPGSTMSRKKFITFPLGKTIGKIEIIRKMSEPK